MKNKKGIYILVASLIVVALGLSFMVAPVRSYVMECMGKDTSPKAPRITHFLAKQDSVISARLDSVVRSTAVLDSSKYAVSVYSISSGRYIYEKHERDALIPASCMKIATAVAAYEILGEDFSYKSEVLTDGEVSGDTLHGNVVLYVDDDPRLSTFDTLTYQMQLAGVRYIDGSISYEVAREDTLKGHPSTYAADIKLVDIPHSLLGPEGAKASFELAMQTAGIVQIDDREYQPNTEVKKWTQLASFESTLRQVLTPMVKYSSNIKAEELFYRMDKAKGIVTGNRMEWDRIHAVERFWQRALWPVRHTYDGSREEMEYVNLIDGCGLSTKNKLNTHFIIKMLQYAWNKREMRDYFIGEALATPNNEHRQGSLVNRMLEPHFTDRLFAKTGTMPNTRVSSLSGFLKLNDNDWYIFSIINQDLLVEQGRAFQDEICTAVLKAFDE